MRARKAHTAVRQEQITRAAMHLLALKGWHSVSLTHIARQVGVVPSAVYRHFSNKDAVLDAVLELVADSFRTNVSAARAAVPDPVDCLGQILRRHVDLILSGVPVPRIVLSEEVFTGNPRRRRRVQQIYSEYLGSLAQLVIQGQADGGIRPDLDASVIARMWLGLVQSPAILWLVGAGDFDLRRHCEESWNLFAAVLRSPHFSPETPQPTPSQS